MSELLEILPDPARVIEGLRDTGYEFNTSIADLIDNSIAADANRIDVSIDMDYKGKITVRILDNGTGMDRNKLEDAMRYGSPPRTYKRSLGKFGLGMKTASTSFCTKFSVISRYDPAEKFQKATWDLDHVKNTNKWEVIFQEPSTDELQLLDRFTEESTGTLVVWSNVDRLLKEYADPGGTYARRALDRKIGDLRSHLGMVFQRFLDFDDPREEHKIELTLNGDPVTHWDPFCLGESELVEEATIPVEQVDNGQTLGEFTVRAYILPRKTEFSSDEAEQLAQISNYNQGIYVYRENRLIQNASWLGFFAKEPHWSLLRVEFSFGAELDDAFHIDIKKSRVTLHDELADWFKTRFLPPARRAAEKRYRKGKKSREKDATEGAHDPSNRNIGQQEGNIPQADIDIVNEKTDEVEVTNPKGTTRIRLKISQALRPGEVYVQPVDSIDDGLLWEPVYIREQEKNYQGIQLNKGHEFYRKVYIQEILSENRSNITIQGIDALLWALGVAELRAVSETTQDHFEEMRFEISRILRKLVENLPEHPDVPESSGSDEEFEDD